MRTATEMEAEIDKLRRPYDFRQPVLRQKLKMMPLPAR
jgi:hypothetical protein